MEINFSRAPRNTFCEDFRRALEECLFRDFKFNLAKEEKTIENALQIKF